MQQYLGVLLTPEMTQRFKSDRRITAEEFAQWKKTLVFDQLRGIRMGQSFCNYFDIEDALLYYNAMNTTEFERYVAKTYLS